MIHYTGLSLRRFPLFGVLAWLCFTTVNVWGGEPKGASAAQNQKAAPSRDWAPLDPAGDLEAQLRSVPQVDLDPDYLKKSKQDLAQAATEILNGNKEDSKNPTDAFVRK